MKGKGGDGKEITFKGKEQLRGQEEHFFICHITHLTELFYASIFIIGVIITSLRKFASSLPLNLDIAFKDVLLTGNCLFQIRTYFLFLKLLK